MKKIIIIIFFSIIFLMPISSAHNNICQRIPHIYEDSLPKQVKYGNATIITFSAPEAGKAGSMAILDRTQKKYVSYITGTSTIGTTLFYSDHCTECDYLLAMDTSLLHNGDILVVEFEYIEAGEAPIQSDNEIHVKIENNKVYFTLQKNNKAGGFWEWLINRIVGPIINKIEKIPEMLFNFVINAATNVLNFLSSFITNIINSFSGEFGVAKPIAATAIATTAFIAFYLIIKLVLYLL